MSAKDIPENGTVELVPCSICGRKFAADRIQTHASICGNHKERKVFNPAVQRVKGTDAEEMLKTGKLKLEPPKRVEKKSALNEKVHQGLDQKDPLPPIPSKKGQVAPEQPAKADKTKTADGRPKAYQVVFDANDGMKTKKTTKFPTAVPPPMTGRRRLPKKDVDDRYLSAERAKGRWKSAASRVNPGAAPSLTNGVLSSEEEDFLQSSLASQKTVRSDAFDFLFDSQNLNPEKVLNHSEIEKFTEEHLRNGTNGGGMDKNVVRDSQCCVVS